MRAELLAVAETLTTNHWVRIEAPDVPQGAAVLTRQPSARERQAVVRGYRRTALLLDIPVVDDERLVQLAGVAGGLLGDDNWHAAAAEVSPAMPKWLPLAQAATTLVGLAGMLTVGVSLHMENADYALLVLPWAGLGPKARVLMAGGILRGNDKHVILAATDAGRILLPDVRSAGLASDENVVHMRKDVVHQLAPMNISPVPQVEIEAD